MSSITDKQALAAWENFHKAMLRGIEIDDSLTRQEIERQRKALEADPIKWIKFFSRVMPSMSLRRSMWQPYVA